MRAMPNDVRTFLGRLRRRILDARGTRFIERRLRGLLGAVVAVFLIRIEGDDACS